MGLPYVTSTGPIERMLHRKWGETKQSQVRPSNQLLLSFPPFPLRHPDYGWALYTAGGRGELEANIVKKRLSRHRSIAFLELCGLCQLEEALRRLRPARLAAARPLWGSRHGHLGRRRPLLRRLQQQRPLLLRDGLPQLGQLLLEGGLLVSRPVDLLALVGSSLPAWKK